MGKSTISMAIFNSFLYVYQRVNHQSDGTSAFEASAERTPGEANNRVVVERAATGSHRVEPTCDTVCDQSALAAEEAVLNCGSRWGLGTNWGTDPLKFCLVS